MSLSSLEKLLFYWLIAAVLILSTLLGMLYTTMQSIFWTCGTAAGFIVLTISVIHRKSVNHHLREVLGLLLVMCFLCGTAIGKHNEKIVKAWFMDSIHHIDEMVRPTVHHNPPKKVVFNTKSAEKIYKKLESLIHGVHPLSSYLVSFDNLGIIQFKENEPIILNPKPSIFIHYNEETNEIVYTDRHEEKTIIKAKIQDDSLYKIWETKARLRNLHHWGDVFDGFLYQPGRRITSPDAIPFEELHASLKQCKKDKVANDTIEIYNEHTGEHLNSIFILDILKNWDNKDVLPFNNLQSCGDPFHLNSIQILHTEKHASYFPNARVGDLIISLRSMSTILLLDQDTFDVKWYIAATPDLYFEWHHSPRITDRGTLLLYDNYGGDPKNGRSRILEIDIDTKELLGLYEASGEDHFEANLRGKVDEYDSYFLVQDNAPGKHIDDNVSAFILECDEKKISRTCTRTLIFDGKKSFRFDNMKVIE